MGNMRTNRLQKISIKLLTFCLIFGAFPLMGCTGNQSVGSATTGEESTASSTEGVSASAAWYDELPRESWSNFEEIDVSDVSDWYTVYELPNNVYAIEDTSQWEEDIVYLVIGEDRAALIDTTLGISPIKPVVDKLTDLPITVFLTHTHHDHIGGAHEFDDVWCFDSDDARQRLETGIDEFEDVTYEVEEEALKNGLPDGMAFEDFEIKGVKPAGTFKDGDTIDLGGRSLSVVHTPGHTSDSCCFIDRENGILFSGDTYYPDDIYAFSADADVEIYAASLHKLAETIAPMDINFLCTGHNEIVTNVNVINDVANNMDKILDGSANEYTVEDDGYRHYSFDDDIVIITEDKDQTK